MPRVEINVVEAQGLPVADLNGKADPYVEVCSASERQKTDIKKKTLNPVFNEIKVVNVADMMRDAIGFLVWDWDRMSANEIIAYGSISMIGLPPNGAPLDYWVQLYKKGKKDDKKEKKDKKAAKAGKPPSPKAPGGRLHIVVRLLDVPAMAPMPVQPMPGQPMMAPQPMPGQPMPGQPMPGQPMPGQPMPGQPMPGQPMMAPQPMPGQPMMAPQPMPGQPMMAAPMAAAPMPLLVPAPYSGAVPVGFLNKNGYLRPKKTGAEVAGHIAGKGAKKGLKGLVKILT
jgi:hypothetical protein